MLRWTPPITEEDPKPKDIPVYWNLDRYLCCHIADRLDEFMKFSFCEQDEDIKSISERLRAYSLSPYISTDTETQEKIHTDVRKAFKHLGRIIPSLWD